MWQNHESVKAQDGVEAPAPASSLGIWDGGTNFGTLTSAAASIVQPAQSITRAGNYMFIGNLSVQETSGGYPEVGCYDQVGSTTLLPSITGVDAGQHGNVTTTDALKLSSTKVPASASLICSNGNNSGTAVATSASISIFPVGTLQIGK